VNVEKITRVMDLAEKVTNRAHTVLADAPEGFFIVGTKATGRPPPHQHGTDEHSPTCGGPGRALGWGFAAGGITVALLAFIFDLNFTR
jgi:hypothetical protein